MSDDKVDLATIDRQLRQISTDVGGLREDIATLTAIAIRMTERLSTHLAEMQASHPVT